MRDRRPPSSRATAPRRRVLLAAAGAALLAVSCGGKASGPDHSAVVLQPNARVLDAAAMAAVSSYDFTSGTIQLSSLAGSLAGLAPGAVIGTAPTAAAPHGFLRRVTSVTPGAGGAVTLQTVQAGLDEAIRNGSLSQKITLSPATAHVTPLLAGVGFRRGVSRELNLAPPSGASSTSGFDLPINLNVTDSGSALAITGDVAFFVGLDVGANVDLFCGVDGNPCAGFHAVAELVDHASVQVQGTIAAQLSKSIDIASIAFDPITFFIGPWPVVIVPQLKVSLNLSGTASVTFTYAAAAAGPQFAYGAAWDSTNGWQTVNTSSGPSYSSSLQNLTAQLTVAAKVPVQFEVLLYDVVGPIFTVAFGLDAAYQVPHNPVWEIDGTVEADFGITLTVPIIGTLGSYQATLLKDKVVIAAAPNSPPRITIVAPASGSFVNTGLPDNGWVYLEAQTDDDEDGPGCCTVNWTTSPGSYAASGLDASLDLAAPATYTVTGTATDSGGASTSASVTVTAGAPPVAARFLLPGASCANRLRTGEQTTLEADPGPGLTGLPFSCAFTSDDPSDTGFPLTVGQGQVTSYTSCEPGSAGCCLVTPTFATPGTRTLTVTVTQYATDLVTVTGTGTAQQVVTVTDPGAGPQPDFLSPGPSSCAHRTVGEVSGALNVSTLVYGGTAPVTPVWTFQPAGAGCAPVAFTPKFNIPPSPCLLGQICPASYTVSGPTLAALGTTACPAISPGGGYGILRLTATDATAATGDDFFWVAVFNDAPPL